MSRRPAPDTRFLSLQKLQNTSTGTHLFTDAKLDDERRRELERYGYNTTSPHFMLREVDRNVDIWDTLTPQVVNMMLNPPDKYDPQYQKKVATALLTVIGALSRK
jgi:hypothetical protein